MITSDDEHFDTTVFISFKRDPNLSQIKSYFVDSRW